MAHLWCLGTAVLLGLGAVLSLWLGLQRGPTHPPAGGLASAQGIAGESGRGAARTGGRSANLDGSPKDIVVSAVHAGLSGFNAQDEAFRVTNVSTSSVVLSTTWRVRDESGDEIVFPAAGIALGPGASIWCARNALSFTLAFGFEPSLEYGANSTPGVPDMLLDRGFGFADGGGSVLLYRLLPLDEANADGGPWPAGSSVLEGKPSMERIDPALPDGDQTWESAFSMTVGLDVESGPIAGTPKFTNSVYAPVGSGASLPVVINEVAWAGTDASHYDEWIELYNNTDHEIDLAGWLLAAADGEPTVALTGTIPAHGFYLLERTDDSTVSNKAADQIYTGALENSGEALTLHQAQTADVMIYGQADASPAGWVGPALQRYDNDRVAVAGQILFRKRHELTGWPMPDTDAAGDWANSIVPGRQLYGPVSEGDLYGKRVMYPGWDWDRYTRTLKVESTAALTVAIAPDNAYAVIAGLLEGARHSILIQAYTFESVWLTEVLADRIRAGVRVTMLLEGAPAGGLSEQELWCCKQVVDAGGHVYFMHNDSTVGIRHRYPSLHGKTLVVDGERVAIGSENFGNHAMPVDEKSNGTWGDRGVILVTDQAAVVEHVESLLARDCDPGHHRDIVAYGEIERYTVSPTYTAAYSPGGGYGYTAPFSVAVPPFAADQFEVMHSPETGLRYSDGLIGLLLRAGPGDEVYVEQMIEPAHWGTSGSDALTDPNPRVEAYIQAARNGARVRVLLDSGFDDLGSNHETALYLLGVARVEGLDLDVRLGNPTGRGIHSKVVLADLDGAKYVHVGSINGSEVSSKANRELALQVRSSGAYDYVRTVFEWDWGHSAGPYEMWLPAAFHGYVAESNHVLISEVMFKEEGELELGEWVEIYNPTRADVDVSGWLLGDAVGKSDYERMFAFPPGTIIQSYDTLVIARHARAYHNAGYASQPDADFELNDSNQVPDMVRTSWGSGEFALGNAGDEVILMDAGRQVIDVVAYGTGRYPGVVSFDRVGEVFNGNSLERWPANRDSDDCRDDFRVRYLPEPGRVVTW